MINVPPTSDHAEVDLGPAAGVTDRGLRHLRNEDAVALGSQQTPGGLVVVAVVCDGVSSSPRPDEASQAAARASLPVLLEAVRDSADLAEACVAAVAAARASVAGLGEPENERSATTFLSAVAARDQVTLCWLGDSRAYWLAPAESESEAESAQLTRDDSVAEGMVEAGLATEDAAMALPHAHVLTRWLDAEAADLDGDPARAPHVERYYPARPRGPAALLRRLVELPARRGRTGPARPAPRADRPARRRERHGAVRGRGRRRRQHHRRPDPLPHPRALLTRPRQYFAPTDPENVPGFIGKHISRILLPPAAIREMPMYAVNSPIAIGVKTARGPAARDTPAQ